MTNKTRATIYVLLCVALWALIPVVAKTGQTKMDNHQFLFWSSLVSFVVLASTAGLTGKFGEILKYTKADWIKISVLGLLGTYVYYLLLYFGYSKSKGMDVLVVQYTWPFLIVLFSIFILKEKLTWRKAISVIFGFGGVIAVLTKGNLAEAKFDDAFVIGLVLIGSACFALFSVLSKPIQHEPTGVTSVYFLAATLASFASMLYFSNFAWPTPADMIPILANGILVNGFSYLIWLKALKLADASYLAPYTFITPALSAIYLTVFFKEEFYLSYAIGIGLIIIGGLINRIPSKK